MDVLPHLLRVGLGEGFQRGKAGEQGGGDFIDPLIGALGGQPDGK